MPLPVVGSIVRLVGSGIGLARESYLENKEKKELAKSRSNVALAGGESETNSPAIATSSTASTHASEAPPEYIETTPEHARELIASGKAVPTDFDDSSEDEDEEEWKLDEAADFIDPPSYEESESHVGEEEHDDPKKLIRNVMILAPPVTEVRGPIPVPVVIPQRRPRAKGRGFVRAYSPVLDGAALNERCFLEFLKCFHAASKASKGLQVVFLAAGVVGFVPEVVAQIVSTVVQVGAGTAMEIQSRHRANTFLDEMNEKLFKPRGLYAIVMSFKPNATKAISTGEFDPTATVARYDQSTGAAWRDQTRKLRIASGTTHSDLDIGETAPLVFPVLEQAAADPNQSKWNSAKKFLGDYGDKRAQAVYQKNHPDSKLATPAPAFRSRFSDPNHAVSNGNIVSLISGGLIDPSKRRQEKRDRKRDRRIDRRLAHGLPPPMPSARDRRRSRGDEPKGFIKKALTEDVLYLMIVNMPSEQELAAARVKLAQEKNKSPAQSSSSGPPPNQWASNSSQPVQSGSYMSQPGQPGSYTSQPGQWPEDSKSYPPDGKY